MKVAFEFALLIIVFDIAIVSALLTGYIINEFWRGR